MKVSVNGAHGGAREIEHNRATPTLAAMFSPYICTLSNVKKNFCSLARSQARGRHFYAVALATYCER